MKLLWITERYPPLSGGMAVSAARQVDLLRKSGWHIDVLAFMPGNTEEPRLETKKRDGGEDIFVIYPDAVANAIQKSWQKVLELSLSTPYALVVGFGCNLPGHIATTFAAWLKCSSMVSVRGNDFDRDWFDNRRQPLVAQALSRADLIGCVSREKADKIQALFPDRKVEWLINGIDAGLYQSIPTDEPVIKQIREELNASDKKVIGIFGEIKYKKRIPFFIEALRTNGLLDRVALLLVGKMDSHVDKLFNDNTLVPQFKHLSFRPPEELPALYQACDFVAIPSLFEGFPNVLLECMAARAVPIVSNIGAMSDVITDGVNGFCFKAEDYADASRAVEQALSVSPEEHKRIADNARDTVLKNFSQQKELESLKQFIQEGIA